MVEIISIKKEMDNLDEQDKQKRENYEKFKKEAEPKI